MDFFNNLPNVPTVLDSYAAMKKMQNENALAKSRVAEEEARANYFLAKAKQDEQAAAAANPIAQMQYLQGIKGQFQPGSPQYTWADNELANIALYGGMAAGKGGHGGGMGGAGGSHSGAASGAGGMGAFQTEGDLQMNDASIYRVRGSQYIKQNPDGSYTVMNSPTTPTVTQNQSREQGGAEANVLYPVITQGLQPYRGMFPTAKVGVDMWNYSHGNKEQRSAAEQNLINLAHASRLVNEAAATRLRQLGITNPGEGQMRDMVKQMFPGFPSSMLLERFPSEIQTKADQMAAQSVNKASQAAIMQTIENFPQNIIGQPPAWTEGFGGQGRGWDAYVKQQQEQLSKSQQQNNTPQTLSAGNPFADLVPSR